MQLAQLCRLHLSSSSLVRSFENRLTKTIWDYCKANYQDHQRGASICVHWLHYIFVHIFKTLNIWMKICFVYVNIERYYFLTLHEGRKVTFTTCQLSQQKILGFLIDIRYQWRGTYVQQVQQWEYLHTKIVFVLGKKKCTEIDVPVYARPNQSAATDPFCYLALWFPDCKLHFDAFRNSCKSNESKHWLQDQTEPELFISRLCCSASKICFQGPCPTL